MNIFRTCSLRLKPVVLALALTGTFIPAHATGSLHEFLKPAKPLDPAQAKEQRKTQARVDAEKKRAAREVLEKKNAEKSAQGAGADDELASDDGVDDPAPASATAKSASAPAAPKRFSSDAGIHIEAAVRQLGLTPTFSAQAAGLMIGATGPWAFTKLMGSQPPAADALEMIAQDASSGGVDELEDKYARAEKLGHYVRYAFLLSVLGGLAIVGYKFKNPPGKRGRSRTGNPPRGAGGSQLSRFFGRTAPTAAAAAGPAASGPTPLDLGALRDCAFNLLFARGRHDLKGCNQAVTPNLVRALEAYFRTCEARGHWNKVEWVSRVDCQLVESWVDDDVNYARVSVSWQAIDYVVNFNRRPQDPGYVVEGRPTAMDTFMEDWTVVQRPGEAWLVDSMCPSSAPAR